MSQAMIGWGTYLKRGNGATPEVFTAIAELLTVTPPSNASDEVEVTHLVSAGKRKEFIQGLIDSGECAFTANFIPTSGTQDWDTGLISLQAAGDVVNWRIECYEDDLTTLSFYVAFAGFVKTSNLNEISAGATKVLAGSIRCSGDVTWGDT